MKIIVDTDVAKVAEFMEGNIPANNLRRVAVALVQLAELLWVEFEVQNSDGFRPFDIYREEGPHIIIGCDVAESPQRLDETLVSQKDPAASGVAANVHHVPHTTV